MKSQSDTPKVLSANLFPVVGIGASAGGLDAFRRLLKAIPENSGMAYVLVQHLDPNHDSLLPELLQKVTKIPVLEISDDIKVRPDHIYIIPSNKMLVANDGVLQLSPRPPKSKTERNLPIDLFFTSLAEVHQAHAIGVILSGTASDGTKGLRAIKEQGGITFAQDEASAAYESMPQSAVHAGVVDFILPPEEIPLKLIEIKPQINQSDEDLQNFPQPEEEAYRQILMLLRIRKVTDFTYYKQTTIRRRILRRMAINKAAGPADYLKYLRENKTEQDALFQDLLIPVTAFFRDPKIFDHLRESVFPQILKNKMPGEPIRIWVAGCSTGKEAYSIAMYLKTFLDEDHRQVQIFATDISEPAIEKARSGKYTKSEIEEVTDYQLQEFFTKSKEGYQINKPLRDMCVFAMHNFLKDPPFGKIDFLSCRNVLIYMEPYLQKRALTTFHYALNPKGILLLGKSETSASMPDLFIPLNKQHKIFTRKDVPSKFMHVASPRNEQNLQDINTSPQSGSVNADFQKAADDIMLSRYTPAGVVVNELMDIVHFRGSTGNYLEQAPGKPSHNLLKMAKNGLAFELRNILHKAKKENTAQTKENIPVMVNGTQHIITIEAIPLRHTVEQHYLILFHDHSFTPNIKRGPAAAKTTVKSTKDEKELYIGQLEKELEQTREDMRSITEEQEAANEELQSANEELLSGSEELQSLNEELETSKEELQSTNEELMVVTQEMIGLNAQVTEALEYTEAIIATIHEPMLVLDKDLRVQSANQSFYKTFHVTEEETKGGLFHDLGNKQWNIVSLRKSLVDIILKNTPFKEVELTLNFPGLGERIMLLNASRIVQKSVDEHLILLAINDITDVKLKAIQLQLKEKQLIDKDISNSKAKKEKLEKAVTKRTKELEKVNKELAFQNEEKEKRAAELIIANKELVFQNAEKEKRAAELIIANKELAFQNEEKEKRAAELTLANAELALQNEEKEKRAAALIIINKELESFTYVSSHDLQEPLRKIQTFSNLVYEKEQAVLSDKGKEHLQRIQAAAQRMQQLISDLLAFSRLNSAERKFEKIEISRVVEEVITNFKETIEEKHATIEAKDLCPAEVIAFQFRQLMQNLIGNALKFSDPARPPHILITSEIVEGKKLNHTGLFAQDQFTNEKKYCHLSISDNGIGFEDKYKDRIFEVFQRLHGKDEYAGTGIGLSIVKKIVENHSGVITASGELHKGAKFEIYIPA